MDTVTNISLEQIQTIFRFTIARVDDWKNVVPDGEELSKICISFHGVIQDIVKIPHLPISNELKDIETTLIETETLIKKFLHDDTIQRLSFWDELGWKCQRMYLAYDHREKFKSITQQLETSRKDLLSKLEFSRAMDEPSSYWHRQYMVNDDCFMFWKKLCGQGLNIPNWSMFAKAYQNDFNHEWDSVLEERIRRVACTGEDHQLSITGYVSLTKKCGFPLVYNELPQLMNSHAGVSPQTRMEVARMVNDLITYYSTETMRNLLISIFDWYKGYNKRNELEFQERANEWGRTMLAIRGKPRKELDAEGELAYQVDMARRTYSFFFQRFMVVCTIGQLTKEMFKEVDFPGKARMYEFIEHVKPLDKANYLIVMHGKEEKWESKQPKVYTFLKHFIEKQDEEKDQKEKHDADAQEAWGKYNLQLVPPPLPLPLPLPPTSEDDQTITPSTVIDLGISDDPFEPQQQHITLNMPLLPTIDK